MIFLRLIYEIFIQIVKFFKRISKLIELTTVMEPSTCIGSSLDFSGNKIKKTVSESVENVLSKIKEEIVYSFRWNCLVLLFGFYRTIEDERREIVI